LGRESEMTECTGTRGKDRITTTKDKKGIKKRLRRRENAYALEPPRSDIRLRTPRRGGRRGFIKI